MSKRIYVPPDDKFYPIPSTGGRYEMTKSGLVRHAETRHILSWGPKRAVVCLSVDGKHQTRTIGSLKWEVFGILPRHKSVAEKKRRVWAKQGNSTLRFKSFRSCAKFLAPKTFYSPSHILSCLGRRVKEFAGYEFTYPDENK